jgi:Cas3, HD domain
MHSGPSIPNAASLWAKLERNCSQQIVGWHSLVDHSADVAAVVEALLTQPS